jgi:hypothetical protein
LIESEEGDGSKSENEEIIEDNEAQLTATERVTSNVW